jgi:hypothetical protein
MILSHAEADQLAPGSIPLGRIAEVEEEVANSSCISQGEGERRHRDRL